MLSPRVAFSTNSAGTAGNPCAEGQGWTPYWHHAKKINFNVKLIGHSLKGKMVELGRKEE